MDSKLINILNQYGFDGEIKEIKPITVGHINDTFVVEYNVDGKTEKYLLQWINHNVFKKPISKEKNPILWQLILCTSKIFKLGDTFEVYCQKIADKICLKLHIYNFRYFCIMKL